jgi:hypothetical protein
MDRGLRAALKADPDYSEAFADRVAALARAVADELAVPVEHDADMNYSAAQKLVVWLNGAGVPVEPRSPDAIYRLNTYFSSKGRYFTFVTLALSASGENGRDRGLELAGPYWVRLDDHALPAGIVSLRRRLASFLRSKGNTFLEEPILSQEAAGHFTQMDEKPATVFEVLFSELD